MGYVKGYSYDLPQMGYVKGYTVALLIAHPNHFGEQREEGEKGEEDFSFPFGSRI